MRRTSLALATLLAAICVAAAGCGGEEEASPSPQTVSGSTTAPSSSTSTTTTSGPSSGNAAAGKAVFTGTAGCSGCHTLKDAGATGNVGPNLDQVKPPFDKVVTQVTNGGAVMPAFKSTLTPKQIADVAAYVSSVAGK